MAIIEINNLKKYFGPVKAVDGIDLSVEEGEIVGFLGPNGAGKTTTICCALGLLKSDEGSIKINGYDSWNQSVELKNELGFIPADSYFYPNWSVKEHLNYFENIKGKAKLLHELVDTFELNTKGIVKNLSTGNRQKLSIIIAMMHAPKILILDEPTRGLDPLLQNLFYKYLRKLQKSGSTIFMSSHNLPEVETVCSKIAIIKEGKLVEVGDIKKMQSKKVHIINLSVGDMKLINEAFIKKIGGELKSIDDKNVSIKMTGDLTPLLSEVIKWKLNDITISNANLEEIFLEFYK